MAAENFTFNDIVTGSDGSQLRVEGSANVYYDNDAYNFSYKIYDLSGNLVSSGSRSYSGDTPSSTDPTINNGNGNYTLAKGDSFSISYHVNSTQGFTQNPSQATFTITGINNTTYTGTGPVTSQQIAVCFTTGTLIATARGDVAIEDLMIGDFAVTASGALRPIVWIGHKVMDCTALATPSKSWPVRIRAGAFGSRDGIVVPERDLYLSPGHPVQVGEGDDAHLVPIMCLINGTTIERAPADKVTYWHVELDAHDVLLAEGLAAESYLDWGDRSWFANADDHALANPDFVVPGLAGRCLPVAFDGPVVEAERRRLDAVFAQELAGVCVWPTADEPTMAA